MAKAKKPKTTAKDSKEIKPVKATFSDFLKAVVKDADKKSARKKSTG